MPLSIPADRERLRSLSREELADVQWSRAASLYRHLTSANAFYRVKLSAVPIPESLADWSRLPTTTKSELSPIDAGAAAETGDSAEFATARNRTY